MNENTNQYSTVTAVVFSHPAVERPDRTGEFSPGKRAGAFLVQFLAPPIAPEPSVHQRL